MPVPPPGAPPHRTDAPTAPVVPPAPVTTAAAAVLRATAPTAPAPRAGRTYASGDDRAFWRGETFWRDGELLTAEAGGTDAAVLERARQLLARPLTALTGALAGALGAWAGAPVRWAATGVAGAALTVFATLIVSGRVVTEGPVVLRLTATHGVHAGDLAVLLTWAAAETALVVAALHGGTPQQEGTALPSGALPVTATTPVLAQESAPAPTTTATGAPAAPAPAPSVAPDPDPVHRRSWAARTALSGDRPLRRDVDPDALHDELLAAAPAPRAPEGVRV